MAGKRALGPELDVATEPQSKRHAHRVSPPSQSSSSSSSSSSSPPLAPPLDLPPDSPTPTYDDYHSATTAEDAHAFINACVLCPWYNRCAHDLVDAFFSAPLRSDSADRCASAVPMWVRWTRYRTVSSEGALSEPVCAARLVWANLAHQKLGGSRLVSYQNRDRRSAFWFPVALAQEAVPCFAPGIAVPMKCTVPVGFEMVSIAKPAPCQNCEMARPPSEKCAPRFRHVEYENVPDSIIGREDAGGFYFGTRLYCDARAFRMYSILRQLFGVTLVSMEAQGVATVCRFVVEYASVFHTFQEPY